MCHTHHNLIHSLIQAIGDNPDRDGVADTPQRVVAAWQELFCGYKESAYPKVTVFANTTSHSLVSDHGTFYSHCEHHLLPFFGHYYFSYIPGAHVIGLSKIQRLVTYHAARLQTQEQLAVDIVDDFVRLLAPHGAAITLSGRHLCREMRGVRSTASTMWSEYVFGSLRTTPELRTTHSNRAMHALT